MRVLPPRMQDKIHHDLILPEETLQIRKSAREFAVREVAPVAYEIAHKDEHKESFPFDVFHKLAKGEFYKLPFPKEVGGLGLKYPVCSTVVTVEELAYISNSVAAVYDVHCILAGHALMYGSDFIKQQYLRPITTG